MYTYTEAELLRVARVRTDPVSTQRMIDQSEADEQYKRVQGAKLDALLGLCESSAISPK